MDHYYWVKPRAEDPWTLAQRVTYDDVEEWYFIGDEKDYTKPPAVIGPKLEAPE